MAVLVLRGLPVVRVKPVALAATVVPVVVAVC